MDEQVKGLEIVIQVSGFGDAKRWMYRLIEAGVATCSSCDKPANRIWWNDAAEWYFECDEHFTDADMWGGSTRWNPSSFSKRVIPDAAQSWVESLPEDQRKSVRLQEYDATDYYELLPDDHYKHGQETLLRGSKEFGTSVVVYPLKDGRFAYNVEHRAGERYCYTESLCAPFSSVDAAVEDARKQLRQ